VQVVGYERAIGLTGLYLYALILLVWWVNQCFFLRGYPLPPKKVDFKNGRNKTLKR